MPSRSRDRRSADSSETPDDLRKDEDNDVAEYDDVGPYRTGLVDPTDRVDCDEHGNPVGEIARLSSELNRNFSSGALGARRIMAATYQSCHVLKLSMGAQNRSNIYNQLGPDRRPECTDHPQNPRYLWGGRPYVTQDRVGLFRNNGAGIDCTGFINAAWAAQGMRVNRGSDDPTQYSLNTIGMLQAVDNPNSCLQGAEMSGTDVLRSGDVIVQQSGWTNRRRHAAMVETVGADPFGLRDIQDESQCTYANIDTRRFDFTLIQSTSGGSNIGVSRWRAKDYLPRAGAPYRNAVVELALKACKAKFRPARAIDTRQRPPRFGLIRHSNSPECQEPNPPMVEGEECTANCPELRRGSGDARPQ